MLCKHEVIGSSPIISNSLFARLVELVDTSDLKSDSILEYRFKSGNEYFNQNDGIGRHARFRF